MADVGFGLMAFPSGDLMRRSATPFSRVTMADGRTRTTPASTITGSVLPQDMLSMQRAMQRRLLAQAAELAAQKQQTLTQVPGGPSPLSAPKTRGALAGALAGLQYAGPQMQPTSFAQGLGVMGQAAIDAYDRASAEQAQREMEERQRLAAEAEAQALAEYRSATLGLKEREISAASGKTQTESDKTRFTQEKNLREEHRKASTPFIEAKTGFTKLQNAAMSEPSGAGDLAIIFGYMKVLDPGSVVREGEFANAENTGGVPDRIRNLYNKVIEGQRLSDPQRANFIASARTQFAPYLRDQEIIDADLTELAEAYGLDPSKVVLSRIPAMGDVTNPYMFASEADANSANLPSGTYVLVGNRLAKVD